ncbi:Precorrin-6Y C(5,15)-methyltransferase [decarboxylating] [Aquimixticola soesokkakensis]|uniref:Precorrin-6Y C(5,15)-methyltransferase [decarboxylating] n=1 Tax=Aquimixticola soesokkakensis TaxID=1519096 RepID=A0A1Y5RLK9_9RHOB|nr:precorrin-6y C5,15-methyltransferase (decarboxylating) subunit CbiE [Aquimixticola soesokkakensis]SLN17485.1 Precorrin-6Y C(5,15)-methyltransferase [decarboxylating] [Aquimixticola soesokkakensis]
MSEVWLNIVGLGADGIAGLSPAAASLVRSAQVLVGGARHLALVDSPASKLPWPSPFSHLIDQISAHRGKRVVVLVSGDPMWFSAGATLAAQFGREACVHPHPSAFQLAAARMGWALQHCETLSAHGRASEAVLAHVTQGAKLLVLTSDGETPDRIAALLRDTGFGASRLTVLGNLGATETRQTATAREGFGDSPALNTLAIDCRADEDTALLPRTGLPDAAYASDGTMTKQEIRAVTLAKLVPVPRGLLWDVGAGAGSVAIEWMRAASGARAIAIEPRADRRAFCARNAMTLGTPTLDIRGETAPDALDGLPAPDAVFVGGGLTLDTFAIAHASLRPMGRFVANTVTLEGEATLLTLHQKYGGTLSRLSVERAEPIGRLTGWRASRTVTQWSLTKR